MFVKQDAAKATMNLKNLKSLFIISDETEEKSGKKEEETAPVAETKPTPPPTPANTAHGSFEEQIAQSLFAALETNNLEGFDYFEFKNSLKALAQMPFDEATRFRSAFATASTVGLTVEKLLQTADHYLKVLGKEHTKFMDTVSAQRNTNVSNKETSVEKLTQTIQEKSEQIKKLTEEIQQHQAEIQKMHEEMALAKARIEQAEANFNSTYTSIVTQMTDDVEKIKKYLGPQQ